MRKPTHADAELLLHLYEVRRESELRTARKWFLTEFQGVDWTTIKQRYLSHSDEDRWFRMTVSYWEMVATMVNHGVLHADLFFDHTGEDIVTWERCTPWIEGARRDVRPTYLYQLERMVVAHQAHRQKSIAAFTRAATTPGRSTARRPARRRGR
jgi:hypothetical protein